MNKKIILASVLLILAVLVFASCGKKAKEEIETTAPSKSIEISTDADGNRFVTNSSGTVIPVTTDKDGNVELLEDLLTKSAEQVSKEKEEMEKEKTEKNNGTTSKKASTTAAKGNSQQNVVVGSGDPFDNEENAAVIDWR